MLLVILIFGSFLRFYRLSELMPFFGDTGWFYLSAQDMVLTGNIPLVGITSSHTWLHQGPLWTYILSVIFLFSFNPVYPAYVIAFFGVVTVWLLYKLGTDLFSKKVGLISAALYATSPLIIIHSRTPYHTSLIPFFTVFLIWVTYKWVMGNTKFFPLVILFLSILYNLELATAVFWFILAGIVFYGLYKNKNWSKGILKSNIFFLSFLAFVIPMLPILLYDFGHGFAQTAKFAGWIGYRVITSAPEPALEMFSFLGTYISRLIFLPEKIIAIGIILFSLVFLVRESYVHLKDNKNAASFILLFLYSFIPIIALLINKTPSEAYLPMLFPQIVLIVALFFTKLMINRIHVIFTSAIVILFMLINSYFLIHEQYFMGKSIGYGPTFINRTKIAKEIIKKSHNQQYNLVGKGEGSQFESFIMTYEYLLWYLGKAPSEEKEKLIFTVLEEKGRIYLE